MKPKLQGIEDWTGPPAKGFPWLRLLLGLLLALYLAIVFTGCAGSAFYGPDGKKRAQFQGDMTGSRLHMTAAGDVDWQADTVDHSTPTTAQGTAIAKDVSALGATAYLLH